MLKARKAELGDVPALFQIINHYASERVMLPRTLTDLYQNVWEFTVADRDGKVLGCGALKFYSDELAEIRSLGVAPGLKSQGVGRALVEHLIREAEGYRLKTLFALTVVPEFFAKCGFREVARQALPMKIWRDCVRCEKFFRCDEKAMVLDLRLQPANKIDPCVETMKVCVQPP